MKQKNKEKIFNENNQNKRRASLETSFRFRIKPNITDASRFSRQKMKRLNYIQASNDAYLKEENDNEIYNSKSSMSRSESGNLFNEKTNKRELKKAIEMKKSELKKRKSIFDINYNNKIN